MRLQLLTLISTLTSFAFADVQFVSPAPGASVSAGSITVTWRDSGEAPALSDLATYDLYLMVGGQVDTDAIPLGPIGTPQAGTTSAKGTIDPTVAESLPNGFYLRMISTPADGGQVINYSDRFTVTGMTGTVAPNIKKAVTALGGSTVGPPTVNEVNNVAPVASVPADPAAGDYGVPYGQQKGPTKYAPMQKVPPTKITAKKVTPLNPTSAWTVATTWLPKPTVISTVTEPNTFSVRSRANTVAPQSKPTGDMQKFLARWKD